MLLIRKSWGNGGDSLLKKGVHSREGTQGSAPSHIVGYSGDSLVGCCPTPQPSRPFLSFLVQRALKSEFMLLFLLLGNALPQGKDLDNLNLIQTIPSLCDHISHPLGCWMAWRASCAVKIRFFGGSKRKILGGNYTKSNSLGYRTLFCTTESCFKQLCPSNSPQ